MELIKIDPARRRKYRFVIYTVFGLLLATLVGSTWVLDTFFRPEPEKLWTEEELLSYPDVQMFRDYVRIDTSRNGNEIEGAEFLAEQLESAGIPTTIERLGDKHANVWGILEGEEPGAVVLHNHIDVYEVRNPDDWSYPPFGGEIDGPWMYSRGVFDMKSLTITQLRAIQELAASGVKPRKSVIFLATSGEETGSDLGVRWILDKHPELTERFDVVLTEGGVVEPKSREEIKYWGVEFAQKRFATLYVCSDSRERLDELRKDIVRWRSSHEIWVQTEEVDIFSEAYAPSRENRAYQELLEDPWGTLHDPKKFRQLPDYLKASFREEVVPFPVEETADGHYRVRILLHLLPGSDVESLRARLLPDWMLHGLAVTEQPPLGTNEGSPIDDPAFLTVLETVREFYPDTLVGPHFLAWSATDSRFFREAGITSYGFSPFLIFSTDTYRVDAVDERISLPGFMSGLDLYVETIKRLAS
jgi:acetylornithine deacetylase/succinyl-diaminopimelate desuccinylase-like protein